MAGYGQNDSPVEFGGYGANDTPVADGIGAKPKKRSIGDIAGDVGVTALKSAVGLPQSIVGLADIPAGGRVGKALEGIGYRPAETQKFLDTKYSEPQQAANKSVRDAEGFVPTLKAAIDNPSAIATTVGESLAQMIGGAGIARGVMKVAPKIPAWAAGAIGEGAIGAGSAAENMRAQSEDGLLTPKQSIAAAGSGAGTALFGAAGGKLAQRFGLGDVDTILTQGGPNAAAAGAAKQGFFKQVVGSGIAEGVFEELPQSVQEQMWQNYATDKPLTDGVGNAAAMGLLAGTVLGGAGGGYNALAGQPGAVTPPPEERPISGLLTNPASIGTPSDQVVVADVARANAVAAAQANADALYKSRDEYEAGQQALSPNPVAVGGIGAFPPVAPVLDARQTMDVEAKAQLGDGALGRAAAAGIDSGAIAAEQILQPSTGVNNGATGPTTAGLAEKGGQSASDNGGQGVSDVLDTRLAPVNNGLDPNAGEPVAGVQPDKPADDAPDGASPVGPSAADIAAAARAPIGGQLSNSGKNSQIDSKPISKPITVTDSAKSAPIARVGTTPKNVEDITVKDGVIYMGKFPAQHFETGEDIRVGENADFAQVKKALQDGKALSSKQKVYPGVFGSKAKADQSATDVPSATSADISGNNIDDDWTEFSEASGTLGINRADMPQIKSEHRGAMVNFLNARGITSEQDEVLPDTLKATQREFSRAKVEKAKGFTGNDRSILVSSDGYVLDGHHQWLAKRETGKPVKVIRLNAPIKTLLDDVKAFPSAQGAGGAQIKTKGGTPPTNNSYSAAPDVEKIALPNKRKGWKGGNDAEINVVELEDGTFAAGGGYLDGGEGFASPVSGSFATRDVAIKHVADNIVKHVNRSNNPVHRARVLAWLKSSVKYSGSTKADEPNSERRHDASRRKSITDMTPDEMRRELLIDPMTGLGNRRAYEESEKLATQVSIDADGLKWINDNLGHESGDRLLETIGKVIAEETDNGYHISGDEYVIQANTKDEADAIMARVVERLNGVTIEGSTTSGSITMRGIGISYGVNGDLNNAEKALREHKAQREREGLRGGRGAIPPNAVIGKQNNQDQQNNDTAEEEAPVEAPKIAATGPETLVVPRNYLKRIQVDMPVLEDDGTVTIEKRSALAARESLAKQKQAYEALRACVG